MTPSRKPHATSAEMPVSSLQTGSHVAAKLSVNETTTYRWSLDEDVQAYRRAGFDGIGVWRPKLVEYGEDDGIELLRDAGLEVTSLSWVGGFTGTNGHSFREAVDDGLEAIRTAAAMGAECLVVLGGSRAGHTLNHARDLVVDGLRFLGDYAAEYELPLALQPMHRLFAKQWTFINSLDETLEILDRCDCESLRMAFDVYHLWQEPNLLGRIADIAPRVATVQLSDWRSPPRSQFDRHMLGEGEIPLEEIVAEFLKAGYDRCFDIAIWSEALWRSDYTRVLDQCRRQFETLVPV